MINSANDIIVDQIWAFIAYWWDFKVYHYGDNQVIKYSRISLILGSAHRQKLTHDYETCKKYLQDYIVDVVVMNNYQYTETQDYIDGEQLLLHDLDDPEIRDQFSDIVDKVKNMEDDGYAPIDLIGVGGLRKIYFSNIIVDSHKKLRIIDATLLECISLGWRAWICRPLLRCAVKIQHNHISNISNYKQ